MNKFKVSTRLTMLIGVLSALLVAIGSLGLFGIGQSNDALKSVFEDRTVPAAQLGRINALILHNRMAVNIALVTPTPEVIKERSAEIEANMAAISRGLHPSSIHPSIAAHNLGSRSLNTLGRSALTFARACAINA